MRDAQSAASATGLEIQVLNASTSHEINVAFAALKALGLEVPPTLLARADEVIE